MPLSWRHFVYGSAHLARTRARTSLQMAGAFSAAQAAEKAPRDDWYRTQEAAAGW